MKSCVSTCLQIYMKEENVPMYSGFVNIHHLTKQKDKLLAKLRLTISTKWK